MTDMGNEIIKAEHLNFGYGGGLILEDVSFTVHKGDFVSVIGSNGTGKSTLMKILIKELSPLSGNIEICGKDIKTFNRFKKIGYLPQSKFYEGNAFPATVMEIVLTGLYAETGLFRFYGRKQREKAQAALEFVGMRDYAGRLIGALSGGQQQRVMIARLLASEPEIMLLDEPASGVDNETVESIYGLLLKLNREKGVTVVMVTHDISRASKYADRTLCLEYGNLIELDREQVENELSHRHIHHRHAAEGEN